MLYGSLPDDLGLVDLSPIEMMFWMYCPISLPGDMWWTLPDNLYQYDMLVQAVRCYEGTTFTDRYVYLTAKTLYVSPDKNMNRPGWHSDGFGTDDVNYIWSDRVPTEFLHLANPVELSDDCTVSMQQMEALAPLTPRFGREIVTYPDRHLLRLDPSVIHRASENVEAGMRTFLKVSISKDRYDLKGNARNHRLPESRWPLVDRQTERNHPASAHV